MAWNNWLSSWNNAPKLKSLFALNDHNCPHVWGIGADNKVHLTWRTPGGGWSAWLPGWNNAPKVQTLIALNDQSGDTNCPHVWAIGTDNTLHLTWRAPGGGWSAWTPGWNNAPKLQSIYALNDQSGDKNCPHVWGIGTDNTVYLTWRGPGGSWSAWMQAWNNAPKLQSIFAINDQGPKGNCPHVWGIGTDNTVYLTWRKPDGTWSAWMSAWNNAPKLRSIFALNDQSGSGNCPHVWGIGTDNTVYLTWRSPSGCWYAWTPAWNGAPRLRSLFGMNDRRGGKNCLHLWGVGTDNKVYLTWRSQGGGWSNWMAKWNGAPDLQSIFALSETDNAVRIWGNTPHVWGISTNNVLSLTWRRVPDSGENIDYLIITDDNTWDTIAKKPNGSAGAMSATFQPLADWKQTRGYRTAVITVTDIMNDGRFSYRGGLPARDIQEVIRNFLKTVARPLGIKWLLLGGVPGIIPVRHAYNAPFWGLPITVSNTKPLQFGDDDNKGFLDGKTLHVYSKSQGNAKGCFAISDLDLLIKYDTTGTSDVGWHYCNDKTYSQTSQTPTSFMCVKGPANMIGHQIVWDYQWDDGIPTDLYYSSLYNPAAGKVLYDVPYKHDWDLVDMGLYVLADRTRQWGGFHKQADVSVGRAPVRNAAEAAVFVNKVIAYEKFTNPTGKPLDAAWPRNFLYLAATFCDRNYFNRCGQAIPNPGEFAVKAGFSLLQNPPQPGVTWRLFAQDTEDALVDVPYSTTPLAGRYWYYVAHSIKALSEAPALAETNQTAWIVVVGASPNLRFVMDQTSEDGDMVICEKLRTELASKLPGVFSANRLFEDVSDLTPAEKAAAPVGLLTKTAAIAAFNKNPHFVVMCGHGSSHGVLYPGGRLAAIVDMDLADAIATGFNTCIVYAKACDSGNFEDPGCIGSALVCHPNGGAVAFIGHARAEFGAEECLYAFFRALEGGTRHLGALCESRLGLGDLLMIFELNLLGDPEMPIRLIAKP